jgi:hypothetical protein
LNFTTSLNWCSHTGHSNMLFVVRPVRIYPIILLLILRLKNYAIIRSNRRAALSLNVIGRLGPRKSIRFDDGCSGDNGNEVGWSRRRKL